MSRGRKKSEGPVSHREAMKKASESWPKEKEKILRRIKRAQKQNCAKAHTCKKPKVPNADEKSTPEK